jgi:nitronate monooxygenase
VLNWTWDAWRAAGQPPPGNRPGEGEAVARGEDDREIARYSDDAPLVGATGDIEAMALYAGQCVGLARRIQPAGEIVREVAAEAAEALSRAHASVEEA